jgi:hypothetical protein
MKQPKPMTSDSLAPASLRPPVFATDDNAFGGLTEWLTRVSRLSSRSARRPLLDSNDNAYGGLLEWLTRDIWSSRV